MQLQSIEVRNFKGIKNIIIEFEPGFNIFIGDNGVGKTSILEAIAVGLGGFLAGVNGVVTKHISQNEVRVSSTMTGDGAVHIKQEYPVRIECDASIYGQPYNWVRQKKMFRGRTTVEPRDFCRMSQEILDDTKQIAPVINYQSAARMWAQKRERSTNLFKKNYTRSVGYIDCLAEESNTKMLLNWCKRMEEISWQEEKKISEYEAVKDAVAKFMKIMCGEEVKGVRFHKRTEQLVYSVSQTENIPMQLLSAGYQSVIWMVMDIAYRMAVLNPDLRKNVIVETPGIVLIDELDLHLHPKWQWKIIEALKATFPRVQFIATTHSPLIIASCKNERLIMIDDKQEFTYTKSAYGYQVNHVLQIHQNSNERVVVIKEKISLFYKALDEGNYQVAQVVLSELSSELEANDPDLVKAKVAFDLENAMIGE